LTPKTRARFRKWRVSNRQIVLVGGAAVLLIALSVFSTWSLFTKAVDKQQLADLADENRQLRSVNQEFENSLRELKGRLAEFEQRTHQLAIVAGLDATDIDQQSGVGGGALETRSEDLSSQLDRVEARLQEQGFRTAATPSISPVRGILTSGYGHRADPVTGERAMHRAIDLSTAPGQPILATADGIVLQAESSGRLGNSVYLAHGFGLTTRYGHMSRFTVRAGERVQRGDVIGYVGNTGRATGFHLHYEVRLDGRPVNPLHYILDETPRRF
jgi:murein DD-endopeptidase MepM/ murein hydrolase activator NlpD